MQGGGWIALHTERTRRHGKTEKKLSKRRPLHRFRVSRVFARDCGGASGCSFAGCWPQRPFVPQGKRPIDAMKDLANTLHVYEAKDLLSQLLEKHIRLQRT